MRILQKMLAKLLHKDVWSKGRRCPICGERITVTGRTTDGRLIGSCGDAFQAHYEYIDERCPDCGGELQQARVDWPGHGGYRVLNCYCGWEERTRYWVPQIRTAEDEEPKRAMGIVVGLGRGLDNDCDGCDGSLVDAPDCPEAGDCPGGSTGYLDPSG